MAWLFLILAILGGTILVCQFVLMLIGFGADMDIADDLPDDVPDGGHWSVDPELGDHAVGHGNLSTWIFGVLSFKTLTAAAAFFGLAGCAAHAAHMTPAAQLTIATLAGLGAMYGVHWIMRSITRLSEDGTVRLDRSVGKEGTVYLTVPGNRKGTGKVQFKLQNRLVEYPAITNYDETLPTGRRIRIVNVVNHSTVEIEPWVEPKPA